MPLNGHSYLVGQGWKGDGEGLRQNAISKPLAIPQKRTLAGLGKDRDEAFPFWDHLFTVAAKTIQVKLHNDGDNDSNTDSGEDASKPALMKTSTGLISNKRPVVGTPASSGSSTPFISTNAHLPRANLLAIAKRESARKGLYARFFRGPVIAPELLEDSCQESKLSTSLSASTSSCSPPFSSATSSQLIIELDATTEVATTETSKRRDKERASKQDSKKERRRKKESKRESREREAQVSYVRVSKSVEGSRVKSQDLQNMDVESTTNEELSGGRSPYIKPKKRKRNPDENPAVDDVKRRKKKKEKKEKREKEDMDKIERRKSKKVSKKDGDGRKRKEKQLKVESRGT